MLRTSSTAIAYVFLFIHLRCFMGSLGVDVQMLPKLMAEVNPAELKRKVSHVSIAPRLANEGDPLPPLTVTTDCIVLTDRARLQTAMHLDSYDSVGQSLFLQTLRIMRSEMKKRYQNIDPMLEANMREVEKITEGYLKRKGDEG